MRSKPNGDARWRSGNRPEADAERTGAAELGLLTVCPGCGLRLPSVGLPLDSDLNASGECRQLYWQLSADTLSRGDPAFIHQYAVDAYAAQHAGGPSWPITTAFALVGVYLACERGFSGRDVQRAHMLLARRKQDWPRFPKPEEPGALTVRDVLQSSPGAQWDQELRGWACAVWAIWHEERDRVIALANCMSS